jgi:hypothetical protein
MLRMSEHGAQLGSRNGNWRAGWAVCLHYRKLEDGSQNLSVLELLNFADALGIDPRDLFTRSSSKLRRNLVHRALASNHR